MIKLIGSTEIKITNDKNGESVPHLSLLDVINVWHLMTVPQTEFYVFFSPFEKLHINCIKELRL